ncbi:serine/threonine protein kinase [Tuwongella immobilis]|uniref:Protein kinase domain-containing protein n=1 Tax=Tuwongella immobilis TaxID=692036 RepID=A0A6C2YVV1_9BACT|nr:protein kinase [Tuwongella immobilis]VIP05511.1 serine threonine-protein kinase : Serine/threonine protein kinase-related protein OS=Planctomyces limnophilus (strain ATCC 43296 / DSM 3776 / IFAM 1008 / 290) GN=Plim_2182 PE=4 SV=1: Pkinase [Tuwongella immobilis]VTS08378.1 serine threonine-protein kinase : Serine/threonine protein kinase-related protein OS=Planctomyces limnophilus (strain ATCC 43296 / DSM 3776 / IFAM 1008 / 290) GN=Plim_2182 PE=4 SV=1: Pkinase [Tuwongella immobilis]
MTVDSTTSLLEHALRLGLLTRDQLDQLYRDPETPLQQLDALQEFLIHRQLLTRHQAETIRSGQGGELIFSGYRILEPSPHPARTRLPGRSDLAIHPQLHTIVQIDRLEPHRVPPTDTLADILKRAQQASRYAEAALVNVIDAGSHQQQAFLVTESPDGQDVYSRVRSHGAISVPQACKWLHPIAVALGRLHQAGIVHGEIRPGNLLITPAGIVKLVGTGQVVREGPLRHRSDLSPHKPHEQASFQPEERWDSGNPTAAADVYSLAASFMFLIIGDLPGSAAPSAAVVKALGSMAGFLKTALSRNPAERPAASAFAEILKAYQDDSESEEAPLGVAQFPADVPLASLTGTSHLRAEAEDAVPFALDASANSQNSAGILIADPVSGILSKPPEIDGPIDAFVPSFGPPDVVPPPNAFIPPVQSPQPFVPEAPAFVPHLPTTASHFTPPPLPPAGVFTPGMPQPLPPMGHPGQAMPHAGHYPAPAYPQPGYPQAHYVAAPAAGLMGEPATADDPYSNVDQEGNDSPPPRRRQTGGSNWKLLALGGLTLHLTAMLLLAAFFLGWFNSSKPAPTSPQERKKSRLPPPPGNSRVEPPQAPMIRSA